MPNVVNPEIARAFAREAAGRIPHAEAAARFEKLAFQVLLCDERNLRPATIADEAMPDWVRRARARGEAVHLFALHRGARQRLNIAARRLADVCAVAMESAEARPERAESIRSARAFIAKLHRMSFDAPTRKAFVFSRLRRTWIDEEDADQLCPEQSVNASTGHTWTRVTSLGRLRAIGREFRNCLANTSRRGAYAPALTRGSGQFWVLRSRDGVGLAIAFAGNPRPTHFIEVKGPRNAHFRSDDVDLRALASALGIESRDPPHVLVMPAPPASWAALRAVESEMLRSARARLLQQLVAPLHRPAYEP